MTVKWDMVGKGITTAEMAQAIPAHFQRFRLPTTFPHSMLQGVGLGVIFYLPTYTNLFVEIWNDRQGLPTKKLATTTTWAKTEVDAQFPKAYKFLYMGFDLATPLMLRKGVYYNLALRGAGYTGDVSNHIAWRHAFPVSQYVQSQSLVLVKAAKFPLESVLFTAEA